MSVAELSGIDRGKGGGSTVQGAAGSQEHGVQKSWGTRSAIHGDILLYAQTEREIVRIPEEGREGGVYGIGERRAPRDGKRGPGPVGLRHRSGRKAAGPERGADPGCLESRGDSQGVSKGPGAAPSRKE